MAAWRWGTLADCFRTITPIVDTLIEHFEVAAVSNFKLSVRLDHIVEAFRSLGWRQQYDVVEWITLFITELMSWGDTCPCPEHAEAREAGKDVECLKKDRLISTAYKHACSYLPRGLAEANGWTLCFWGRKS